MVYSSSCNESGSGATSILAYDDEGDDVEDEIIIAKCSFMTSYLPVGYRADSGNCDKRKSTGASQNRTSNRYQLFDLV